MGPTTLELLETKVQHGEPLTLDERVFWHEAKQLGVKYRTTEPVFTSAQMTIDFLARHGLNKTREDLAKWLDDNNVPK